MREIEDGRSMIGSLWEMNMRRLLLVVVVAAAGCNETIPGQCNSDSDCLEGDECYRGFCIIREFDGGGTADSDAGVPDGGGRGDGGADDGGIADSDAGKPDGGGQRDGGADATTPAPGGKWEAATCGSAYGDKTLVNSSHKLVGSLNEPTPGAEGGSIEMKNSSHRCIGGFNAALRSR
jgi:hypothetical protein